jgi:hypothetical protein
MALPAEPALPWTELRLRVRDKVVASRDGGRRTASASYTRELGMELRQQLGLRRTEARRVVSEWRRGEALPVGSDRLYAHAHAHAQHKATPSAAPCSQWEKKAASLAADRPAHAKGFFRF